MNLEISGSRQLTIAIVNVCMVSEKVDFDIDSRVIYTMAKLCSETVIGA